MIVHDDDDDNGSEIIGGMDEYDMVQNLRLAPLLPAPPGTVDKSVAVAAAAAAAALTNIDETTEVRQILSIEPITATEVPIVTTRPEMLVATSAEMPMDA